MNTRIRIKQAVQYSVFAASALFAAGFLVLAVGFPYQQDAAGCSFEGEECSGADGQQGYCNSYLDGTMFCDNSLSDSYEEDTSSYDAYSAYSSSSSGYGSSDSGGSSSYSSSSSGSSTSSSGGTSTSSSAQYSCYVVNNSSGGRECKTYDPAQMKYVHTDACKAGETQCKIPAGQTFCDCFALP